LKSLTEGLRPIAAERDKRFLGKVQKDTARCRGGENAIRCRPTPWVDWQNYWGTGDSRSKGRAGTGEDRRGVDGALLDLEYQRIELIKFNLFDNSQTYEQYVKGRDGLPGPSLKVWSEMRLPKGHPNYEDVGGDGAQLCKGELIRHRTLTGICNDIRNPNMGATHQLFGRLVELESTFPDLGKTALAKNRHDRRLDLLKPDPQVISRKLFTRVQAHPEKCRAGLGLDGDSKEADCDYLKASSLNVLAAFWIQFMTHDWFSHLEEGHNRPEMMQTGCLSKWAGNVEAPLRSGDVSRLRCRPNDRIDKAYIAEDTDESGLGRAGSDRVPGQLEHWAELLPQRLCPGAQYLRRCVQPQQAGHLGHPQSRPRERRHQSLRIKRVLLRTVPELAPELTQVVNVFDPWARDRGAYYSLEWKPRRGAESDESFRH
jgi:hypothetical protein